MCDSREFITAGCSGKGRVRGVVRWIVEDPSRPRSIESVAGLAALSTRAFTRLFARETGTTPARFIERERVRRACLLMETTDLRMAAIAARSGFGADERMRRAFHRVLGASPREHALERWRRSAHGAPPVSFGLRDDA
jgi:transcriptional regulator GlxA family with amidase domain